MGDLVEAGVHARVALSDCSKRKKALVDFYNKLKDRIDSAVMQ